MGGMMRLTLLMICSICIALLLSLLPDIDQSMHRFDGNDHSILTDESLALASDNLVDIFVQLPFRHSIKRIDWNGTVLSVDFKKDTPLTMPNEIMVDLYRLCHFSFAQTTNVDKLLVRFVQENSDDSPWLLTMDANRDDWPLHEADQALQSSARLKAFLERHTNLHYSKRWLFSQSV